MTLTDPIADLLTRIRNALMSHHKTVSIPASNIKRDIVRILKEEGYIEDFVVRDNGTQGIIEVKLKYGRNKKKAIQGLERVSKPGRRIYCGKDDIPLVLRGLGINILSTSRGLMTGKESREKGVGGEILCNIW